MLQQSVSYVLEGVDSLTEEKWSIVRWILNGIFCPFIECLGIFCPFIKMAYQS
jgi:hypothetical protein